MAGQTFCTECGTKLEPGTAFCTNCGTRVGGTVDNKPDSSGIEMNRPVQKSISRDWIVGAGALALVFILVFAGHQYGSDGGSNGSGQRPKISGGKPTLIGKWYRVNELQIGKSDDLSFIELFKDNTLMYYESTLHETSLSGTWTDLEDGRVKMQLGSIGMPVVMIGKLLSEGMLVEKDKNWHVYVNGLDRAKDYALNRAPPGVDKVMALIDQAYKEANVDLTVGYLSVTVRSGSVSEIGSKCRDYTAMVEYKSSNNARNPLAKGLYGGMSREVEGFICVDRDKKDVFKLADRQLKCVQKDFGGRSPMGLPQPRQTECDF